MFAVLLQQSLKVLALCVARDGIGVGEVVARKSAATAATTGVMMTGVVVHVAPVLELLFVVFEQHERREKAVASAAAVLYNMAF